jgi:GNAT superfamily N-acetyltransferase
MAVQPLCRHHMAGQWLCCNPGALAHPPRHAGTVLDAPDPRLLTLLSAPERPGPLMHAHLVATGVGRVRVDRWPDPRAAHVELPGGNHALAGDPDALCPTDLADVAGLVDAADRWLPLLRAVDPATAPWRRVFAALPADVTVPASDARLLGPADAPALDALHPGSAWIHDTWGGAAGLAAARTARAVVVGGRAVSVAVPFYVGTRYEDIGVVTDPAFRRRGLSTACAAAVVADIRTRGRIPTWTTSVPTAASRGVAARLGFEPAGEGVLYAVRAAVPD